MGKYMNLNTDRFYIVHQYEGTYSLYADSYSTWSDAMEKLELDIQIINDSTTTPYLVSIDNSTWQHPYHNSCYWCADGKTIMETIKR